MSERMAWEQDAVRAFAQAHGLTDVSDAHLSRLAMLARRAATTGGAIPRQPSKWTEPAGVFRVPDAATPT